MDSMQSVRTSNSPAQRSAVEQDWMPEYHWQLRGTPLSMEKGQVRWLGERDTELPLVSSSSVLQERIGMNLRVDLGLAGRAGRG